jgi:hypothetical protein
MESSISRLHILKLKGTTRLRMDSKCQIVKSQALGCRQTIDWLKYGRICWTTFANGVILLSTIDQKRKGSEGVA